MHIIKGGVAGLVLVLSLLFIVPLARATTLTSDQVDSIVTMLNSFGVDSGTIANVQDALSGTASTATTNTSATTTTSCVTLQYNLYSGSTDTTTGGAVTDLQQFLGISPTTGYFGPATLAAVEAWQSAQGIASSGSADTTGWGFVGPRTRAAMSCTGTVTTNTTASATAAAYSGYASGTIDSSSLTVAANTTVTLSGTASNTSTVRIIVVTSAGLTVFSGSAAVNSDGTWSALLPALTSGLYSVRVLSAHNASLAKNTLTVGDGTGIGYLATASSNVSSATSANSTNTTSPQDATGFLTIGRYGAPADGNDLTFSTSWITAGISQVKVAVYNSIGDYAYSGASTGTLKPLYEYLSTSPIGAHSFTENPINDYVVVLWGIPTGSTQPIEFAAGSIPGNVPGDNWFSSKNGGSSGGSNGGSGSSYNSGESNGSSGTESGVGTAGPDQQGGGPGANGPETQGTSY